MAALQNFCHARSARMRFWPAVAERMINRSVDAFQAVTDANAASSYPSSRRGDRKRIKGAGRAGGGRPARAEIRTARRWAPTSRSTRSGGEWLQLRTAGSRRVRKVVQRRPLFILTGSGAKRNGRAPKPDRVRSTAGRKTSRRGAPARQQVAGSAGRVDHA